MRKIGRKKGRKERRKRRKKKEKWEKRKKRKKKRKKIPLHLTLIFFLSPNLIIIVFYIR